MSQPVSLETFQRDEIRPAPISSPRSVEIMKRLGISLDEFTKKPASSFRRPGMSKLQAVEEHKYWERMRQSNLDRCEVSYTRLKATGEFPPLAKSPTFLSSQRRASRSRSPAAAAESSTMKVSRRGRGRRGRRGRRRQPKRNQPMKQEQEQEQIEGEQQQQRPEEEENEESNSEDQHQPKLSPHHRPLPFLSSSEKPPSTSSSTATLSSYLLTKSRKEISDLLYREYAASQYHTTHTSTYDRKLKRIQDRNARKHFVRKLRNEERRQAFALKVAHIKDRLEAQRMERENKLREKEERQRAFLRRKERFERVKRKESQDRVRERLKAVESATRRLEAAEREKYLRLVEKERATKERLRRISAARQSEETRRAHLADQRNQIVADRIAKTVAAEEDRISNLLAKQDQRDAYLQNVLLDRFRQIESHKIQRQLKHREKQMRVAQKQRAVEYATELARRKLQEEENRLENRKRQSAARSRRRQAALAAQRREKGRLQNFLYYLRTNHSEDKFRRLPGWIQVDFEKDVVEKYRRSVVSSKNVSMRGGRGRGRGGRMRGRMRRRRSGEERQQGRGRRRRRRGRGGKRRRMTESSDVGIDEEEDEEVVVAPQARDEPDLSSSSSEINSGVSAPIEERGEAEPVAEAAVAAVSSVVDVVIDEAEEAAAPVVQEGQAEHEVEEVQAEAVTKQQQSPPSVVAEVKADAEAVVVDVVAAQPQS